MFKRCAAGRPSWLEHVESNAVHLFESMRLLTFQFSTGPRLGIKTSRGIIDVASAHSTFKTALDGAAVLETIETLCSKGAYYLCVC